MKKIIILIVSILLLTSCMTQEEKLKNTKLDNKIFVETAKICNDAWYKIYRNNYWYIKCSIYRLEDNN